ncbi:AI-2E family transporter [Agrobacterium radiobacter]|nr:MULTISPECIES: AI-2E family transporter [Agrobacterium tumefaciens complex]
MAVSHQGPLANTRLSGRTILILIGVAVILHVGQEIFVPLALSLLLTFTLAPIVSFLRKHSAPKIAAVILAVASAFMAITLFSFVVATQVTNLAENIPTYQRNIVTKVQALSQAGSGNGVLEHLSKVVERVGAELQTRAVESQDEQSTAPTMREPMPVEIVTRSHPVETLGNFILPLIPALRGLKAQERHANRRQYRQAARVYQHFIRENKGNLALLPLYSIRDS